MLLDVERALATQRKKKIVRSQGKPNSIVNIELSKAQGADQQGLPTAQAHAPICTIRSACDQSRRITTGCTPAPARVGCYYADMMKSSDGSIGSVGAD
jgi:hypothetical protein